MGLQWTFKQQVEAVKFQAELNRDDNTGEHNV